MSRLIRRFLAVTVIVSICLLAILSRFGSLALAQESSSFEISITPQAEYVVVGQPFTYTVAVTNVNQTSLKNVFIRIEVPDGAKFINTRYSSLKWYGGNPSADPDFEMEEITLLTPETIEAGEPFNFRMIVEVLPEAGQQITIDRYEITSLDGDLLGTGPPVSSQVLATVPTPTPSPTTTPVATFTPSPTTTPDSSTSELNTRTPTPAAVTEADVGATAAAPSTTERQNDTEENSLPPINLLAVTGLILVVIVIGVVWFLTRK